MSPGVTTRCEQVAPRAVAPGDGATALTGPAGSPPTTGRQPVLTHEVAPGDVEVVAPRGDPDPGGVGADQAGLALGLLGEEGHAQALGHALHGGAGHRGDAVGGLQEGLEEAALVEDHVVRDADLRSDSGV